jgi:glutathione S-transferase
MITLYHFPGSRSSRFIFLLEELGAPYQLQTVAIRRRDGTGGLDSANPHPHGKVPAISDDGVVVFESPAIVLYLTDKFPAKKLGPEIGDKRRGAYLSILAYYGSVLEPSIMSKFTNTAVPRGTAGWVELDEVMQFIIKTLSEQSYMAGDSFTGADVLFATMFKMFESSALLPKSPVIEGYVKRCLERPAYAGALAKDNAS